MRELSQNFFSSKRRKRGKKGFPFTQTERIQANFVLSIPSIGTFSSGARRKRFAGKTRTK
jgi:hypothetical protein